MSKRPWPRNAFARPATRPIRRRRQACLALEQLEERLTPAISLSYHGGPLLTHVQVQGVYYNDPTTLGLQGQFDGFFRDIVQSPWLTQMLANYSVPGSTIGAGSFLGDDDTGLTVPEGSTLSDDTIRSQLIGEIANHKLAAPAGDSTFTNTLYAVFVPAGVEETNFGGNSVDSFIAIHNGAIDPISGKGFAYMVIPYQGAAPDGRTGPDGPNGSLNVEVGPLAGGGPALSEFQELTVALSHELSESIADPFPVTGWDEIGDPAQGQWVTYHGYAMQEEWAHNPTDPPLLALGPAAAPADTDFAVTQINDPTEGAFHGVFATFTDEDGASESPGQFQVGVAWGDGTVSRTDDGTGDVTVTSNGDGTFNVVGRHTYFDAAGTTESASVFVSSGDEIALKSGSPITLLQGGAPPPLIVNTTSGAMLPGADLLSLPRAILAANRDVSGHANITFDPGVFATPQTITLAGVPLVLSNTSETETITGPAAGVTVSGGGLNRVFQVDAGVSASLSGLTITGGKTARNGGGLDNEGGTVTLTDCTLSGNTAGVEGGGLWTSGTTSLIHCSVSGNSASFGGGVETYSGNTTLTGCTVTGNSARHNGGGLDNFGSQTTALTDCTVSGNTAGFGGGVSNFGPHAVTLTRCTVGGNSAGSGGGLANQGGTIALADCTISANSARYGGGLDNYGGPIALADCTISANSARYGGGLDNFGGPIALADCTVSGNSATRLGGGMFNYGTAALTGCTVSGNSALAGGGLCNILGTAALADCTIGANSARYGGGLYNYGGPIALADCTVSGNSATRLGGGMFNYNGTLNVGNTIVAGNTAATGGPDALGPVASQGHNLVGVTDGSTGWVGSDLAGTAAAPLDPLLAPLGNYGGPTQTMPLLPGSPAIDAGTSTGAPATDQRGQGRVGAVDIGAFESQGFTIAVTSGGGQSADVSTAFSAPLVATVTANNPIEPVAGGRVTFTAPSSGASATLVGSPATLGAAGTASVTAAADGSAGRYAISATARGIATPASFGLSNRPTLAAPAAQTAYQNVDQPIGGIRLGDAPGATVTVTLAVGHGTLSLGTTAGLTTVTGNGTGNVTLIGTTADLNAALASLVYRGSHNYSGGDTLSLTATDGGVSATPASVAITVESIAQEAADLQAQVGVLQAAGVLNQGQANSLIVKLNLRGNNGDVGKVQAFLNEVLADVNAGILTQAQADALLGPGNILLLGVTRR
jgi:hypothetical protein